MQVETDINRTYSSIPPPLLPTPGLVSRHPIYLPKASNKVAHRLLVFTLLHGKFSQ